MTTDRMRRRASRVTNEKVPISKPYPTREANGAPLNREERNVVNKTPSNATMTGWYGNMVVPFLRTERRKKARETITPTETRKLFENWKEKSGVEAKKRGKRNTRTINAVVDTPSKEKGDFFWGAISKYVFGKSIQI